jgi:hypothetical protein
MANGRNKPAQSKPSWWDEWWKAIVGGIAGAFIVGIAAYIAIGINLGVQGTKIDALAETGKEIKGNVTSLRGDLSKTVTDAADSLSKQISKTDSRVADVEKEIGGIKTGLTVLQEKTQALARDTDSIRNSVGRSPASLDIKIQFGAFSRATMTSDSPLTYEWKIKDGPIDEGRVQSIAVEPTETILGASFSAKLVNEGRVCRMVVTGDTSKLTAADAVIPGKMTITMRQ